MFVFVILLGVGVGGDLVVLKGLVVGCGGSGGGSPLLFLHRILQLPHFLFVLFVEVFLSFSFIFLFLLSWVWP